MVNVCGITRRLSDGLFLSVAQDVARDYPDIVFDDVLIDRACLHVRNSYTLHYSNLPFLKDCSKPSEIFRHCHGHAKLVRRHSQ